MKKDVFLAIILFAEIVFAQNYQHYDRNDSVNGSDGQKRFSISLPNGNNIVPNAIGSDYGPRDTHPSPAAQICPYPPTPFHPWRLCRQLRRRRTSKQGKGSVSYKIIRSPFPFKKGEGGRGDRGCSHRGYP